MTLYVYAITFLLVLSVNNLISQEVKGKLLDTDHNPIMGAYIQNISSNTHAHTNEDGNFKISSTSVGDSLLLGSFGFQKLNYMISQDDIANNVELILEEVPLQLSEVVIRPQINGLSVISDIDMRTSPVKSSQEILQKVPGLIIGQHAGGGKAEQLFLRGFDIDHGTDIALSVDGMPVNMVSHAHGQGYADLHFLIPETIDKIDFGKGPYYSKYGNFGTAGYVNFETKKSVEDEGLIKLEYGDFGWNRGLAMFNLLNTRKDKAYIATELTRFDGPFESSQNFSRLNIFGKYVGYFKNGGNLSATISHFTSTWDASGQIPERAVENGSITRFGAIDDTEGGSTSRNNINLSFRKILDDDTFIRINSYYSKYAFLLYSNFTFFLEDPINGDQIKQSESRDMYGSNAELNRNLSWGNADLILKLGAGCRSDVIKNDELSHTLNRKEVLNNIQLGDVRETNTFGYINMEANVGRFTIDPALRIDYFDFGYVDGLSDAYENQKNNKAIFSPKLNVLYNRGKDIQYFLKSGIGFHSNDTRVVVARNAKDILPAAYGADLGTIWRITPELIMNTAAWYLYLEQEFVYVGDAGIVEPSGKTERYGWDFGMRYQLIDGLFFNTDITYTIAKSIEEPKEQNYIPLAPDLTIAGGLNFTDFGKFSGGIRYRYLDNRPANEDNSLVAKGYFIADLNMNYQLTKNVQFGLSVDNIFDTEWNETQFATESRLKNEIASVEEIHFTPGTPFFVKGSLSYTF